jgi:hypothetical protein
MPKDTWQKWREVTPAEKLRKTLTIPSFSFPCGRLWKAITSTKVLGDRAESSGVNDELTDAFTLELWCKIFFNADNTSRVLYARRMLTDAEDQIRIYLTGSRIRIAVRKSAGFTVLTLDTRLNFGSWQHLAFTYDGTTVKGYVNGIEQATTAAVASPIDTDGVGFYSDNFFSSYDLSEVLIGSIDEIRIWSITRTAAEISFKYNKPMAPDETGLSSYYTLDDLVLVGANYRAIEKTADTITLTFRASDFQIETTNIAPIIYGASKIVAQSEVILIKKVSFNFPVIAPEDNNFSLAVRWVDDDGVVQRRWLFTSSGLDYAPEVIDYNGERLPLTFVLEIWNNDGESTVDLDDDFVMQISDTTYPTRADDRTNVPAAEALTLDSTLAEIYPLTDYPLEFNSAKTYLGV